MPKPGVCLGQDRLAATRRRRLHRYFHRCTFGRDMRTLVYKMTHIGDPHPVEGKWGRTGCMGQVRGYDFDAVIGVGGTSAGDGIGGRVVWIGVGPRKTGDQKEPVVTFDRSCFTGMADGRLEPSLLRSPSASTAGVCGFW